MPVKAKSGFTFIELSLAIVFVSIMAITVALVINNITAIYSKGLAIKSINSTGSDLIEEFSNTLGSAPATDLTAICDAVYKINNSASSPYQKCKTDRAFYFVFSERKAYVRNVNDSVYNQVQTSGVFCTGKYSYIWNTGYTDNPVYVNNYNSAVPRAKVKYTISGGATVETDNFRFLRIEDPSRIACASQLSMGSKTNIDSHTYNLSPTTYDLTTDTYGAAYTIPAAPTELINSTENALAVYNFHVARPSQDSTTNRLFYAGSFVLATLRGGVDITKNGDFCRVAGSSEDFDYCAINKFNFAAQATGK